MNICFDKEQYELLYKTVAQTLGLQCQLIPLVDFASLSLNIGHQFQKCQESLELDSNEISDMTPEQEILRKDRPTSDIPNPRYRPTLASNTYINAVQYSTYRQREGIIIAQMRTPDTVVDFCRLVKERSCSTILMHNCTEANKKNTKDSLEVKMIQYKRWADVHVLPDAGQLMEKKGI